MVLPIGGFMPIPLALMVPFMFMQSVMMGYGFGTGFQYSKRKISAMSNDEFNATSIQKESDKMFKAYHEIIPSLQQSILDSKELQKTVLQTMAAIPADMLRDLFGIITGTEGGSSGESGSTSGTFETTQETTGGSGTTEVKPTADSFAIVNSLSDQVNKDWYSGSVYRDVWQIIPFGVDPAVGGVNQARTSFIASLSGSMARDLVIQKISVIRSGSQTSTGTSNLYRIIYYLDANG